MFHKENKTTVKKKGAQFDFKNDNTLGRAVGCRPNAPGSKLLAMTGGGTHLYISATKGRNVDVHSSNLLRYSSTYRVVVRSQLESPHPRGAHVHAKNRARDFLFFQIWNFTDSRVGDRGWRHRSIRDFSTPVNFLSK